jgi:hypothetical protein
LRGQEVGYHLVDSLAATRCLGCQCFGDGIIQMDRDYHDVSVTRQPAQAGSATGAA